MHPKKLYVVSPDVLPLIASVCHEANRLLCVSQGDISQVPWEDAPQWQQDSACKGVLGVLCNGNGPAAAHASWLAEKRATGWTYGPQKDAALKTHPCMVPYAELPPGQRAKDHLFVAICVAMAEALQLQNAT